MRANPPPEKFRTPKLGWKSGDASRALMTFAGLDWNGKGLAWALRSSTERVYRWAAQRRHGVTLKEGT